jgi:hypothetical protein
MRNVGTKKRGGLHALFCADCGNWFSWKSALAHGVLVKNGGTGWFIKEKADFKK